MDTETRIARLMTRQGWTTYQMARFLGVSQSSVSKMARGQEEHGAVSRLLDLLERDPAFASVFESEGG